VQIELAIDFTDVVVFFIAILYAIIVLTIADIARRKLKKGPEMTRRIVHLFAGGAIYALPYFTHVWLATIVAALFVIMLALANHERFSRFFSAMARPEDLEHGSVRGPFWYAVSITVITGVFTFTGYERLYFIGAAAIHLMMFGDGMSAPIGMKYGVNSCRTIFGSKRSPHGCAALFVFGFLGAMVALWFFGVLNYGTLVSAGNVLWMEMIILALSGAITATLVELVSPKGTDNMTLPITTCIVMFLVGMVLGVVVP
jgi:phytol kinase